MTKYFVSRQMYWPTGERVVEIAVGGVEYANPDMLVPWYPGEGVEYETPRKALEAALSIRGAWSRDDGPCRVEVGCTHGFTMPFEEHPTDEELWRWVEKEEERWQNSS